MVQQETIIPSLDNNDSDIMGFGMMQKKRGLRFDESPHLLDSQQAAKRASITMTLKLRKENTAKPIALFSKKVKN